MSTFILKRKAFTVYDQTDTLKRMKDSDILAEQKKQSPSYAPVAGAGITGAATGAAIGAGAMALLGKGAGAGAGAKAIASTMGKNAIKGGKVGAIIGAGMMISSALGKRDKQKKENAFYNERLEYAQRQAQRRERKDWKANMTQRDGYSY